MQWCTLDPDWEIHSWSRSVCPLHDIKDAQLLFFCVLFTCSWIGALLYLMKESFFFSSMLSPMKMDLMFRRWRDSQTLVLSWTCVLLTLKDKVKDRWDEKPINHSSSMNCLVEQESIIKNHFYCSLWPALVHTKKDP